MQNGADVDNDLNKLWNRIVFNVCISNTDDHLRNHGFLLTDAVGCFRRLMISTQARTVQV